MSFQTFLLFVFSVHCSLILNAQTNVVRVLPYRLDSIEITDARADSFLRAPHMAVWLSGQTITRQRPVFDDATRQMFFNQSGAYFLGEGKPRRLDISILEGWQEAATDSGLTNYRTYALVKVGLLRPNGRLQITETADFYYEQTRTTYDPSVLDHLYQITLRNAFEAALRRLCRQ